MSPDKYGSIARTIVALAITGVMALSAAPASAGSSHVSLSIVPRPPLLTLSDTTVHLGLVEVTFATDRTSATHPALTLSANQPVSVDPAVLPAGLGAGRRCPSPVHSQTLDRVRGSLA